MQGYSLTQDLTRAPASTASLAACLRDGAAPSLSQYREMRTVADAHAVTPMLRERVLAHGAPRDPQYSALRDAALSEAGLEMRRNARLARSITALAEAGVPSLVFKGSALAHRHYPRPELRPRDDTDLLIRPQHLDAADTVLRHEGFAHLPGVEGSLIMRQRLYRLVDADGLMHNLDLHWALTNEPRADAFEPRTLIALSEPLPALSPHARAPDDTTSLLLACLHLDAHHAGEVRLIWLYDVDRLVRALDTPQRRSACALARERRVDTACAWVLAAAREAFDTPLAGFESLLQSSVAPPAAGQAARWARDLSRLSGSGVRLQWIGQHLFPSAEFMRQRTGSEAPMWRLYAARALRGIRHLFPR